MRYLDTRKRARFVRSADRAASAARSTRIVTAKMGTLLKLSCQRARTPRERIRIDGGGYPAMAVVSQRYLAILAVAEAGLLQVEVALDPSPTLVGNLAVAQQRM